MCLHLLAGLQEVSLQADLRAVVARALSGLDMFSEPDRDGALSPSTSVVTPFSPQPSSDLTAGAALRGYSGGNTVVPRKATMREGVFTGLGSLMGGTAPAQATRHSSTGGAITPGEAFSASFGFTVTMHQQV